jgi:transcriptional regulator with XRE-family HTH domain
MERDEALRQRVARNVKRLRLAKGWSQDDLAGRVGNTDRHVSQIERGGTNLTIDYIGKIARSLATDAADLFFNDDPSLAQPPGAVAIFVSPDELKLLEQARQVLARMQEFSRPLSAVAAASAQPGGGASTSEPADDQ